MLSQIAEVEQSWQRRHLMCNSRRVWKGRITNETAVWFQCEKIINCEGWAIDDMAKKKSKNRIVKNTAHPNRAWFSSWWEKGIVKDLKENNSAFERSLGKNVENGYE